EQVVRQLVAGGRDLTDPQEVLGEWQIPEGVRQVVGMRLSRLTPDCQQLLTLAAILPGGVSWELLAALYPAGEERLLDLLDEALVAHLLRERPDPDHGPAAYEFTHALIRQTLYDGLNTPRRVRLHRQVGAALERVFAANLTPHPSALAFHFFSTPPGRDLAKAIDYARQAGEQALTTLAFEDAATHFARALHLTAPGATRQRSELLLSLGQAKIKAGDRSDARATFEQAAALARTMGAPDLLARAALGLGDFGGSVPGVTDDLLIERLQEALNALGTAAEQERTDAAPDHEQRRLLQARVRARLALELRWAEGWAGSTA